MRTGRIARSPSSGSASILHSSPGARTDVTIAWSGFLVPYTETGMRYVRDHVERSFTILRAESFGFPQIRVPSFEQSRAMPAGGFTYALRVTVPADLVVATGTAATARVESDSLSTWTFASDTPVPFLLVAIAPYETLTEGDLRVFYFPEDSSGARTVMGAMQDAVRTYGRWFGPVGSRLRLHVIEIPEGWGSQADLNAGIIQTADAFRDTTELVQLYHELAHLWHPADVDSAPPRWNEGLATFLSYRMAADRGEIGPLEKTFADIAAGQVTARRERRTPRRSHAGLRARGDDRTILPHRCAHVLRPLPHPRRGEFRPGPVRLVPEVPIHAAARRVSSWTPWRASSGTGAGPTVQGLADHGGLVRAPSGWGEPGGDGGGVSEVGGGQAGRRTGGQAVENRAVAGREVVKRAFRRPA